MRKQIVGPGDSVYHMTHHENIPSILQHGILSHVEVYRRHLNEHTLSNSYTQVIRAEKRDPFFSRSLHEYVPLYFSTLNPMLEILQAQHQEVVIIGVSSKVINNLETIFTDGNAASNDTRFFSQPQNLTQLSWNIITATTKMTTDNERRMKCAEVLVFPHVNISSIQAIYCRNQKQRSAIIESMAAHKLMQMVEVRPELFTFTA